MYGVPLIKLARSVNCCKLQECIPVGCVPSTPVAAEEGVCPIIHWAGGVFQHALGRGLFAQGGGVLAQEGMSVQWGFRPVGGVCPGGVSAAGCLPGGVCPGVSARGCLPGGVCPEGCLPRRGGVCTSACWDATPPNRMTDRQV